MSSVYYKLLPLKFRSWIDILILEKYIFSNFFGFTKCTKTQAYRYRPKKFLVQLTMFVDSSVQKRYLVSILLGYYDSTKHHELIPNLWMVLVGQMKIFCSMPNLCQYKKYKKWLKIWDEIFKDIYFLKNLQNSEIFASCQIWNRFQLITLQFPKKTKNKTYLQFTQYLIILVMN